MILLGLSESSNARYLYPESVVCRFGHDSRSFEICTIQHNMLILKRLLTPTGLFPNFDLRSSTAQKSRLLCSVISVVFKI